MLDVILVVVIHFVAMLARHFESWFLLVYWHNFADLFRANWYCLFLELVLYLPVHLGFLYLGIVYPINGGSPHRALVWEREALRQVKSVNGV